MTKVAVTERHTIEVGADIHVYTGLTSGCYLDECAGFVVTMPTNGPLKSYTPYSSEMSVSLSPMKKRGPGRKWHASYKRLCLNCFQWLSS